MIPEECASIRSIARWVLPGLVGPSTAVTPAPGARALASVGGEDEKAMFPGGFSFVPALCRHCEPAGRTNVRPMINFREAIHRAPREVWIASSLRSSQ